MHGLMPEAFCPSSCSNVNKFARRRAQRCQPSRPSRRKSCSMIARHLTNHVLWWPCSGLLVTKPSKEVHAQAVVYISISVRRVSRAAGCQRQRSEIYQQPPPPPPSQSLQLVFLPVQPQQQQRRQPLSNCSSSRSAR